MPANDKKSPEDDQMSSGPVTGCQTQADPAPPDSSGCASDPGACVLWLSSFIQTVLSASESPNGLSRRPLRSPNHALSARGLYHRLGLAPDPEELYLILFTCSSYSRRFSLSIPFYRRSARRMLQTARPGWRYSRMVRLIRFLARSTSNTLTSTISPTLTASSGCLIKRSVIREICTSPS